MNHADSAWPLKRRRPGGRLPALASITAPSLTSVYPFGLSSAPQSSDVYIQGNLSYPNASARALATQAHEGTKNVYGNL